MLLDRFVLPLHHIFARLLLEALLHSNIRPQRFRENRTRGESLGGPTCPPLQYGSHKFGLWLVRVRVRF